MKEIRSQKKRINIRKRGWIFAAFSLVMVLSLLGFSSGTFSKAAAAGNPLFSKSLEQFYRDNTTWSAYSNTGNPGRDLRSMTFATYYTSQIKPDVASKYNWPLANAYLKDDVSQEHNKTKPNATHDLYLVEFSTANEISNPNINIYWSLYYIEKTSDGKQTMKHTSVSELSRDSRDFMGRGDRVVEFQKGEVEMSTVYVPKGAVPVGICLWLNGQSTADYCPWELSYMNIYKVDSVSGIYNKGVSDEDPSNFYRVITGTRTGYIDQASIEAKYMSLTETDKAAGKTISDDGKYFEWLYAFSPANDKVNGYILEVVTQGNKSITNTEHSRSATFTIGYDMETGSSHSLTVPVNFETVYQSHPYTVPEDYDSNYDFTFGDTYVNPIARAKKSDDDIKSNNKNLQKSFPYNNLPFRENYDMQKRSFTTLPSKKTNEITTNPLLTGGILGDLYDDSTMSTGSTGYYDITTINEFAAMMLGNYFDGYTMSTSYLKEYQATQIPISLPAGIKDFTRLAVNGKNTGSQGIQSIRIIELAEPLSTNRQFNGFMSSEEVLGFKGNLVAKTTGSHPNMNAVWTPNTPGRGLTNYSKKDQIAIDTNSENLQGITVKFSDTMGAGMENLLAEMFTKYPSRNPYNYPTHQAFIYVLEDKLGEKNCKNALGLYNILSDYLLDPLTLTVTYRDQCGDIRDVHIPFVTAYLMQLMMDNGNSYMSLGTNPNSWLSGIFQQGQTAGLRLNLSEFKSLISVKLYYGYGTNNPLTGKLRPMSGDAYYDDDQKEKDPLKHNLSSDSISIDTICFYNNVTTEDFSLKINGLIPTLETSLTASSNWQSSNDSGQSLSQEQSFTAYMESRNGSEVNMFDGAPLGNDYKDQYLVEITTLNTDIAATESNLSYQIHFKDIYGNVRTTTLDSIQGAAKDFYGYGSRNLGVTTSDFQNKLQCAMHLKKGEKICFVVNIPNLQSFEGITLTSDGLDEWQPDQIVVMKLTSLKERTAKKVTTTITKGLKSTDMPDYMNSYVEKGWGIPTYRWDREYTGNVMASAKPNVLLHSGRTSARINFTIHSEDGTEIPPETEVEEVKYLEKIPTTMTYEDTLLDLGLNIVKNTYQVHIDVANVNDAGSSNYFYFQLLFENGRSGLVLANQQLPSDSFRQGLTETFEIKTTQRYGAVKAVRIICEATASTASTFDKLNIDKITVTLNSSNGTGKSWIVDRVGWVNINYVDEVLQSYATSDDHILENRDLIMDFPVTSVSSSTELMFCISTGSHSGSQLNMTSLGDNIEGIITYTDFQNTTRTLNLDIPQKIMDFNENESTSRIMRAETIDRFLVSLPDVKQIQSLTITRTDGKLGNWPIKDITVQKVGGVGDVYLSAYTGEYIRELGYSEYLTASSLKNVALGVNDSKTFTFNAHTIEADVSSDDGDAWNTTITRYPVTSDETLNIYLYLTDAKDNPYVLSPGDNIDASLVYSSSLGTGPLRASFKNIHSQASTATSTVLYAQQLPVSYLGSLKSLELIGNFTKLPPEVKCAYVEHVQGNVIKNTLYLPFNGANLQLDKVSANFSSIEAVTPMKQIVRLQPKEGTSAILTPETSDIAVALRYTSSLDPEKTKMVYQSPYVFLTDAEYMFLNTRDHIEVPFNVNGIGEIVGLTVISNGPTVEFENALIYNYPKTKDNADITATTTLLDSCSIAESFVSTNIISKMMKNSKLVTPVTFTFTTPEEDLVAGSGTTGTVGMEIVYTDSSNKEHTYSLKNILDYLPLDNPPFSDSVASFNILMTDVAYVNSIKLTPDADDWFLAEVNAKITQLDGAKQTTINKTAVVNQWAKKEAPLTIDMRPDNINTDGPVINRVTGFTIDAEAEQSGTTATATTTIGSTESLHIKAVAGDMINFTPTFQKIGNPATNINWAAFDYETFFTDYSDGSATFTLPSEDAIASDNLPTKYNLSAICSENNSLAIPITIEIVSPEELEEETAEDDSEGDENQDDENADVTELTIMVLKDDVHLGTNSYSENALINLDVIENTKTTFEFRTTLNKESALLSASNSLGQVLDTDDSYTCTIPAEKAKENDINSFDMKFNVADAESEQTFTVTVNFNVVKQSEIVPVKLYSKDKGVVTKNFSETTLDNKLTYKGKPGNEIKYDLGGVGNYSLTPIKDDASTANVVESYADKLDLTDNFTDVSDEVSPDSNNPTVLFKIPTLKALNAKLGTKAQLSYDNNGEVTVPFRFELTVTNDNTKIIGEICINVTYKKELTLTLLSDDGTLDTMGYNPAADSFEYDAVLDKEIKCSLKSTDADGYKLEASNANAKDFFRDEQSGEKVVEKSGDFTNANNIKLLRVPTSLTELNGILTKDLAYGDNGTITVPFKFNLYEVYKTDSGETSKKVGVLQINATYQKELTMDIEVANNGKTNTKTKNFTVSDSSYSMNANAGDAITWKMTAGMDVSKFKITAKDSPASVMFTKENKEKEGDLATPISNWFTVPTFEQLNAALKAKNEAEIKPDNGKAKVSFKFNIEEADADKEGKQLKGTITINVTYEVSGASLNLTNPENKNNNNGGRTDTGSENNGTGGDTVGNDANNDANASNDANNDNNDANASNDANNDNNDANASNDANNDNNDANASNDANNDNNDANASNDANNDNNDANASNNANNGDEAVNGTEGTDGGN